MQLQQPKSESNTQSEQIVSEQVLSGQKKTTPKKQQIQETYEAYRPVFEDVLLKIEQRLKSSLQIHSKPTYKARIKSFASYYKKILRQKPKEAAESKQLVTLTDMMGIRVICAFLEDLAVVESQLMQIFTVKEVEKKGAEQSFREFGYESVHVLIAIPEDCAPSESVLQESGITALPSDVVCEIQIRTILQDAWAEVEHELIYKSEFNPFDKPLRRKLASINASLSLADTIFQEIRDYQNKLQSELLCRRDTFYTKADELTEQELGVQSLASALTASKTIQQNPYASGSIDDLVLQALHEHNMGNFSRAVAIYTQILEAQPTPPPVVLGVIYKHRGMAYFAQSEYEKALTDFQKSEENDHKAFRSMYYQGIVYSLLGREEEAVACFDRSLSIDSYQSHVYYRRALSYYNLGNYAAGMSDIQSAINLGLEDADVKALKTKLVQKFDMAL